MDSEQQLQMPLAQNSRLNRQRSGTQGGGSREGNTLLNFFQRVVPTKCSNRSHDVPEFAAAKSESELGAEANSEGQASGAVTVGQDVVVEQKTGQDEKESIFRSSIICRFFQIAAEARAMDRVTKSVYAQQATSTPKPLGIRVLLKRLKYENHSDEDARKMAREYIDQRIYAANVKTCGARTLRDRGMCSLMAVMRWILCTWLPGNTLHTPEEQRNIRKSVLDLLGNQNGPHHLETRELAEGPVAKRARTALETRGANEGEMPQASALVGQGTHSERCFRCCREFQAIGSLPVWSCSTVVKYGESLSCGIACNRSYCGECIAANPAHKQQHTRPRNDFCCPVHQTRPKITASGLFPGGPMCFYCPLGTARKRHERRIRCCQFCSKALCPQCGVFPAGLLQSSKAYTCPGCLSTREDTERMKSLLLGYLHTISGRNFKAAEDYSMSHFTDQKLMENMKAAREFSDFVFDVWRAGWHELVHPFVDRLVDIDAFLRSKGRPVVTTESQFLRMLKPTLRTVIERNGRANARELVLRHRTRGARNESLDESRSRDPSEGAHTSTKTTESSDESYSRDPSCWPEWIKTPSLADGEAGRPSLAIWMHDAAHCSPTTSLSAYVLAKLADSQKFSSVFLCGRRYSAECAYDTADGPVKMLVEAYAGRNTLKLFGVADSDDVIHAWLVEKHFDIILDMTGSSYGKIDGVLSRPRTAVQVAYLGYPGPAFGIWDFVISSPGLMHTQVRNSKQRAAFLLTGNMYPPVGWHNGHNVPARSTDTFDVPEEGRPILAFLGSTDKIDRASVFSWCEMLAGTGDGPKSAILMLLDGPETNVRAVDRWRIEFNEGHSFDGKCVEVISPARIFWFPYRPKESFWMFLEALGCRLVSVSCLGRYDVHTLAGDSLACRVLHLCIDNPAQDWPQRVAQLLVKKTGLASVLVANCEADFVKKGIRLLLDAGLRQAASAHLGRCSEKKVGFYEFESRVPNLENMLLGSLHEARRVGGDVTKMKDIDFTKAEPDQDVSVVLFGPQPELMPYGETADDQFQRFMQQLVHKRHCIGKFKQWDFMFEIIIRASHEIGFRHINIVGLGSSSICARAVYFGKGGDDIKSGEAAALKIPHFGHGVRQENRMQADPNIISLNVHEAAGLRRLGRTKEILPVPFRVWPDKMYAGVVVGGVESRIPKSKSEHSTTPARSRAAMSVAAYRFIENGTMANNTHYLQIVEEYRNRGVISDDRTRIIQAIFFSVFFMNERGIFNMDISLQNLALKKDGHRWLVVWIDTGGSLVIKKEGAAPLSRQSTSMCPAMSGPAPGHSIPVLPKPKIGISYFSMQFVRDCVAAKPESQRALTCFGTDTFRDDEEAIKLRSGSEKNTPFGRDRASRWDSFGAACVAVQSFNPAPTASVEREAWKAELLAARQASSSEPMRAFLEKGMRPGTCVERPEVLDGYARLLHAMLRTDVAQRIGARGALLKLLLTTDTWSLEQKAALDGDGIPFEGGWPAGSPWATAGCPVPRLVVVNEDGMGAGVRTDGHIEQGRLVTLYVGTKATENGVAEFPPSRRTAYAMKGARNEPETVGKRRPLHAGDERIHTVSDQPFNMLQAMNAAGPLLNASSNDEEANVQLDRADFWEDNVGNLYIGMYAKDFIAKGSFLHWQYKYSAGRGGSDAFYFSDD